MRASVHSGLSTVRWRGGVVSVGRRRRRTLAKDVKGDLLLEQGIVIMHILQAAQEESAAAPTE